MSQSIRKYRYYIVVALISSCSTGCGDGKTKVPFRESLVQKYSLTDADLQNIQYYLSSSITLSREVTRDYKSGRVNSKLVERDGKSLEEVYIPSGTPGICTETKIVKSGFLNLSTTKVMFISFESGTVMLFVEDSNHRWTIAHPSNDVTLFEPHGDKLDGTTYQPKTDLDDAYLLVEEDSLMKIDKSKRLCRESSYPKTLRNRCATTANALPTVWVLR
jgi:hypothetical protein